MASPFQPAPSVTSTTKAMAAVSLPRRLSNNEAYVEYYSGQRPADPLDANCWFGVQGGNYRPTWLIRTADWARVPGTEAVDGYCTLSYCWSQSGELIQKPNGDYDCVDNGGHRLVHSVTKRRLSSLFRRRASLVTTKTSFDQILQQICRDFSIEYLWYDKWCINQRNREAKLQEIRQMHRIYSNACYTVALVPEILIKDSMEFEIRTIHGHTEAKKRALEAVLKSQWWKRSWTLEEVMMSSQMLIVGTNTYLWCASVANDQGSVATRRTDIISTNMLDFKNKDFQSASQVLRHAHFRTSFKEHDKIFAMANIFHGITALDMEYDCGYDSDIRNVMDTFYRSIADNDLSIMCFGSVANEHGDASYSTTMSSYQLPSWTGVSGLHVSFPISDISLWRRTPYRIDNDMRLHIKSKYCTINPKRYPNDQFYTDERRRRRANDNMRKVITSIRDFGDDNRALLDWSRWIMLNDANCIATHYWKPGCASQYPALPLSLTEDCDECVVLSILYDCIRPVPIKGTDGGFRIKYQHTHFLPVLKKSGDAETYRAVGIILLKRYTRVEVTEGPLKFLNDTFNCICDEPQLFVIE